VHKLGFSLDFASLLAKLCKNAENFEFEVMVELASECVTFLPLRAQFIDLCAKGDPNLI
jgi:hypothetical protein